MVLVPDGYLPLIGSILLDHLQPETYLILVLLLKRFRCLLFCRDGFPLRANIVVTSTSSGTLPFIAEARLSFPGSDSMMFVTILFTIKVFSILLDTIVSITSIALAYMSTACDLVITSWLY